MNKLNDEEHRRSEVSNTTATKVRKAKTTVEQKFEENGKPVGPARINDDAQKEFPQKK
jgi:hypothetical protein